MQISVCSWANFEILHAELKFQQYLKIPSTFHLHLQVLVALATKQSNPTINF